MHTKSYIYIILSLSLFPLKINFTVRVDLVRSKHMDEWTVGQLSAWMRTLHMDEHVHTLFSDGYD